MSAVSGDAKLEQLAAVAAASSSDVPAVGLRHRRERGWIVRRALATADMAGLLLAFAAATIILDGQSGRAELAVEFVIFGLTLPFWVLLAKLFGLYDRDEQRTDHSTIDDFTGVFVVLTVGTWLSYLGSQATSRLHPSLGRMMVFWLLGIVLVPTSRSVARALCRRSDLFLQNTLVVGTGPTGRKVAKKIKAHPEYGLNVVGFVDSAPATRNGDLGGVPVVGAPEDLVTLVPTLDVSRVVVSFVDDGPEATLEIVRELRDLDVQIDIVPRLYESIGTNSQVHMIEGMPLVGLPPLSLSSSSRFLKRSLDILGSTVGIVLLSPLLLVSAIAVKLDSPGPVFFRQVRRGEKGRVFRIFKFRTMGLDAEARKVDLVEFNMHEDDDPRMFKIPNDPRVTRVGAFLRRWSIDELPQLLNVLKGDMSLVGPRPLILEEDEHVLDWRRKRLELRPGMTGVWQVLGASDIPFDEMTKLDYLYVTNWSLKEDVRLILLTLPSLGRRRKAY